MACNEGKPPIVVDTCDVCPECGNTDSGTIVYRHSATTRFHRVVSDRATYDVYECGQCVTIFYVRVEHNERRP